MKNSFKNTTKELDLISISHYFYPRVGGLENMAFNLISGLTKKGLNCLAVYGSDNRYSTTINGFQAESFKVFNIFNNTYPIFGPKFIMFLFNRIKSNPNAKVIIHSRHLTSSLITALICKLLNHPYTVIEHNAGPVYFKSSIASKLASFADKYIFSLVHKYARNSVSVSETGKKWAAKTFGIEKEDVNVIYNGYNSKEIKNSFTKKENIVVWAAKWIEVKDPNTALRGFIKSAKKFKNWKFVFIGEGDSLKDFKNIPSNLEIIPEFIKQEDLFRLLKKSKIYVNSSLSEGLALGILEATAFGNIPVISNAPSNKELAKEIDTLEYVFKRQNSSDLYRKINLAIQGSKNTEEIKILSKTVKEKFSNKAMINSYYSYLFPKFLLTDNIETLSIVIPMYNEENTVIQLLSLVSSIELPRGIKKEIIIVDDCSNDNSPDLVSTFVKKRFKDTIFKVIRNENNLGKSQSVKKGVLNSTGELVVIQDADLEYNPNELVDFVNFFIENPHTDVIYGNRFNSKNSFINPIHYVGNFFLTTVSNIFTFSNSFIVKDMETCYKMGRGDLFREVFLNLESTTNFGLEPEITARLSKYDINLENVDITYIPRDQSAGKKMKWFKHGREALNEIVRFNKTNRVQIVQGVLNKKF